ncbi:MAG TPA: ferritin-like domain-containing protein [Lacunisphaera sp.]|nr:ferritin-like domain-containing protein [Lacunisphaera sp.]
MSKLNSLRDLYIEQLKDLHSAELQLTKALPDMAKAASDPALKAAFEEHLEQTKIHVERLEGICRQLNVSPKGHRCKAMKGLIAEGEQLAADAAEPAVRDAGLIAAAQRVEHYEIAGYGCVRAYAAVLGDVNTIEVLQQTLDEEGDADDRLTEIASTLNVVADRPAV